MLNCGGIKTVYDRRYTGGSDNAVVLSIGRWCATSGLCFSLIPPAEAFLLDGSSVRAWYE